MTTNTADDFQESPLFYGRWTLEEERYAEMLIEEFRDGNLEETDFEDGPNTLRGFLATKLRCAPKRISKKFESSGYNGRMQYVNKKGTMSPEEAEKRHEKLEHLRQGFEARRRGLPKKPIKKKRSASATSGTNSRRTSANLPGTSAFQMSPSLSALGGADTFGMTNTLGTHGGALLGSLNAANAFGAAPSLLGGGANAYRTDALLGARAGLLSSSLTDPLMGASADPLFGAFPQQRSMQSDALLGSILNSTHGAHLGSNQLLAAEAMKRRMDNARLYSLLQAENSMLHEQMNQRVKLEQQLAAFDAQHKKQDPIEGAPNKRLRQA